MNYLRNLLRKLWPFVTRRELIELRTSWVNLDTAWMDTFSRHLDELERQIELYHDTLVTEVDTCKTAAINNYAELAVEVGRLKPKKKPSRKKPAKKGKKK